MDGKVKARPLCDSVVKVCWLFYYENRDLNLVRKRGDVAMHSTSAKVALLVAVFGFLTGCITVGMFNFENRGKLALSEMSRDQALLLFGPPLSDQTVTQNDGTFDHLLYGTSDGAETRVMFLEFRSDRLNAYMYASSFPEDSTDFDVNIYKKIDAGTHTKADVLNIIGNPGGKALCPSALGDYENSCERGEEVWKWGYFSRRNGQGSATRTKEITIIFDGNGLVVDVKSKVESTREN